MTEAEFQTKVMESVGGMESRQQAMLADYERLTGETKKAFEELTGVKQACNSLAETQASMNRVLAALKREERLNFGDPLARFCAAPERVDWLFGCFRQAVKMPLTPAQRTAVTGVDSGLGAAATPQETSDMIYDALLNYGQWNTLGVIPIGSRTQILPLISARPTGYWVAQGAQITEGAITGTSVTLTIKEAAAWIPVARALLDDSTADMARYLLEQLGQAVAYRLDWACFAADGTDDTTDGAFTGIASGGTAAGAAAGNTTVAALQLEDFVRCLTTVGAGVLKYGTTGASRTLAPKWWIHPTVLAKICQIRDENGRSIFQTALEAPSPGSIGSILGFPVVPTGAMPSTDSAGQVVAVFGDPMAGAVGIRKQFEYASSDDFQFDYNRTCFRAIVRAGFVIRLATSFAKLTTAAA